MPLPFATWTIEDARKAASLATTQKVLGEVAQKYYEGDHWQNGAGWIGPRPQMGEEGANETLSLIEQSFVSRNVIKEIVDRHRRGVIGQEPDWGFTPRRPLAEDEEPTEQEQKDIDTIEAALVEWWEVRKVHRSLKKATATLLQHQRATTRLYVPRGSTTTRTRDVTGADGVVKPVTERVVEIRFDGEDPEVAALRAALMKLHVDTPPAANAGVYSDPATQTEVGIVIYKPSASAVNGTDQQEIAELVWVDDVTGLTVFRTIAGANSQTVTLDLAGHITIQEMTREPLITEQIVQSQDALNVALTVVTRTVVSAGFLERILMNAQMPGQWVDENGEPSTDISTRKRFIPGIFKVGAGTTQFIRGIDYEDPKDASLKVTDPSVTFREPTPVDSPVAAKRSHYQDMLEEADQAHILMSSEPSPSGRSREQARAGYIDSLSDTKDVEDALGRGLLEGALAEAEALAGRAGVYSRQYRAYFSCKLNAGPIDATERAADEASVEKGTMSEDTAMERRGTTDIDAERARINQSDRGRLDTLKRQGEALTLWTTAGLPIDAAAEIVIGKKDPLAVIRRVAKSGGFDEEEEEVDDEEDDLDDDADDVPDPPPPTS